jgi:predicted transcriptional regulator
LNTPILDAGRALLPLIAKSNQAEDARDPDTKLNSLIRDYAYTWKEVVKKSGVPADTLYSQIHSAAAASNAGSVRQRAEFIPQ